MAVIKELATVSFAMQRRDIRISSCHVKDILVKYPVFNMQDLVSLFIAIIYIVDVMYYCVLNCAQRLLVAPEE